ncbi:MAG: tetratricopeptide repeat protein [Limisphaerales bacterium]
MAAPESPDHAGPHQGLWGARFGNLGAGRQNAIVCVVLVLAVWMVFGQTVRFGFVNYDDNLNVYDNGVVAQGLTPQSIPWAFSHPQTANWVPLTTLSHMLDCQIFGLNAAGHHFVNVLWHAAAAVLLFLILREMTGALWRSVFVAALFALHPLRAESVAWVSERKDVLSGFFFMLTIWAYLRYARRPSRGGYVAMAVIFTLGILSKSMLVTEPAVLLLLDYWPLGRLRGGREIFRLILEKTPLLVLALGSCVVSVMVPGLLITGTARLPLTARLANAAVSSVIYLRQMVWPAGLAVPYPVPPHGRPFSEIALATLLLAAITVLAVACRKKQRYLLVGWLWYLVMLIPVAGLVPISLWASHADRYTYLPEIGLAITGTWAFADLAAPWKDRQPILGAFMAIALGILMCCAARQSSYWRDSETLWDRSISEDPDNAVAHCNLGSALAHKGETQPALRQYQMALRIDPHYSVAHCNLGNAFSRLGKIDEAIAEYRQALENNPDYAEAHCNLGNALVSTGKMEEAFTQFHRALASWPDYPQARVGLGSALAKIGRDTEAIAEYRKALAIDPRDTQARYNLGRALARQGAAEEAAGEFSAVLEIDPNDAEAHSNLGLALAKLGQWPAAMAQYHKALEIKPGYAEARGNLAAALALTGQTKEAISEYRKALELNPGQAYLQNSLAWLLATAADPALRDGAQAVALAEKASQASNGADPLSLRTLAAAYAETGNYKEAVDTVRRALDLAVRQKNEILARTLPRQIKLYEAGIPLHAPK